MRIIQIMYKIKRETFGFWLTLSGDVNVTEMKQLKVELTSILTSIKRPFGIISDTLTMIPLEPEAKTLIYECEQIAREAGLQRSAVIFRSPVIKVQATQISIQSETNHSERLINASTTDDWEKVALEWVVDGIEPELTLNINQKIVNSS